MNSNTQKDFKGYNGSFLLSENAVIIKRGIAAALLGHGLKGDKTIPYSSIIAVQFKKAGLTAGYLQLTLKGGNEAKGGLFEAAKDENTVCFYNWDNKKFEEAKTLIEERLSSTGGTQKQSSNLDELDKLAKLKEKGIITEEEFNAKKKQLLGL